MRAGEESLTSIMQEFSFKKMTRSPFWWIWIFLANQKGVLFLVFRSLAIFGAHIHDFATIYRKDTPLANENCFFSRWGRVGGRGIPRIL